MVVDAIILARGGSKGIPKKNIVDFCGRPLIYWTIKQCIDSNYIRDIWVSSDSEEILNYAEQFGARIISRPIDLSGDQASSEASWLHAVDVIEEEIGSTEIILAPQVTSPLRETSDIDRGIEHFDNGKFDSMFSCSTADDLFLWERVIGDSLRGVNHDYLNRKRRQDMPKQIIENGSFYLFKSSILRKYKNRLGGKIGSVEMDFWKMFEIDTLDDMRMCSSLMREFLL